VSEPATLGDARQGAGLTLLHRAYCHLCDELLEALRPLAAARGATIAVVDVDAPANAALEAMWGDRVPVLFLGPPATENELCHYHLDAARLDAALAGTGAFASKAKIR
jgi:hypothetical protein